MIRQFLGDGRHLPRGPARTDDHIIADSRFSAQINLHDVFGLVVFKLGQDSRQKLFACDLCRG
jgi:hypothetical protein